MSNNNMSIVQQTAARPTITASALQQSGLLIRRRRLANDIENAQTNMRDLHSELAVISDNFNIAHTRVITARERVHDLRERLRIETEQVTQELMHSNLGDDYTRALSAYNEYIVNNPSDRNGIISRYDEYTSRANIIIANRQRLIAPLIAEINNARDSYNQSTTSYDNILLRRTNLIQEINDLQVRLDDLVDQAEQLNRARGIKRKQLTRRKKGKIGKKSIKGGSWSLKYKRSINCKRPRGFSQKQYCKYGKK
jgi:chromosome segregation ATPase